MTNPKRSVLIVLAHPEPTSFNHALTESAAAALREDGHQVVISDIYRDGFDGLPGRSDFLSAADPDRFHYQNEQARAVKVGGFVPEVAREQQRVANADLVILQFPLWWGSMPAAMKAWLERVMAYGFAYVDGHRFDTGLFRGRRAILSMTTGGTPARFSPDGVYGPIDDLLKPIKRAILEYVGYEVAPSHVCYAAPRISDEERTALLAEWAETVRAIARLPVDRSLTPSDPLSLVEPGAWARKG